MDAAVPDTERVLLVAPTVADAALSQSLLRNAGLACVVCESVPELARELGAGAAAVVLTREAIAADESQLLLQALRAQPPWSDLPILLLANSDGGGDSATAAWAMETLGNVTVLERPVRVTSLVSALRAAIRSRRRQYELRDRITALQQSDERFKLVAQSVRDPIWDIDLLQGRIWSSEAMHGPPDGEQAAFDPRLEAWAMRRHPEDRERVAASFQRALDGGASVWSDEYRFRMGAGYVHVVDRGHILRGPDGRPERVLGAMLDISDRKRGEEARALHAAIVEQSDDAIVSKDLDGIILSWNAGAERLFGYTAAEAIGRSITLIIPPDQHSEERAILERIRHGEKIAHFETVRLSKHGKRIHISLTVSPIRDGSGRVVGASKVARDITARKETDEILRKQSNQLRLLWEAASALLTIDDPDFRMRALFARIAPQLRLDSYFHYTLNETGDALRLQSYAGISAEAAQKISHLELGQAICGSVAERREGIVASRIQESDDPLFAGARTHGMHAYVCAPLLIDGRLLGTLGFGSRQRDAFDTEEIEFLRTIFHYVTVAYERARLVEELRLTDRRKDEFLATLAHELRNPLAPIRNALEIIQISGDDGAAVDRARGMMERQLGQLVRLIDDLLDVSRITRGRLELRTERVELDVVLRQAVETARPLIAASGHELILSRAPEPLHLDADPVRLAQVFSNLLNNAAKYMEPGGRIWLSAEPRGRELRVSVRDTGMGIPPAALPNIFEMFTQVGDALDKSQGGLGVGLTLVKQLVEMHGGSVEAHSEGEGKGSEFVVRLPLAEAASTLQPERDERRRRASAAKCRVLVADDNLDAADSMGIMLRMMGHDVRTAHDGLQAVEEAAAFRPDVALLDIGMPKLNGYDAARRIREQEWGRKMVLVALTGWGQAEDKRRAIEAGFDRHYTKPLSPSQLEQLMAGLDGDCSESQRGGV